MYRLMACLNESKNKVMMAGVQSTQSDTKFFGGIEMHVYIFMLFVSCIVLCFILFLLDLWMCL